MSWVAAGLASIHSQQLPIALQQGQSRKIRLAGQVLDNTDDTAGGMLVSLSCACLGDESEVVVALRVGVTSCYQACNTCGCWPDKHACDLTGKLGDTAQQPYGFWASSNDYG